MTFVIHFFGVEMWRFSFGQLEEDAEYIHNNGGEFEIPFGFAGAGSYDDEEESKCTTRS